MCFLCLPEFKIHPILKPMRTICCGFFLLAFLTVKGQTLTELLKRAETNYPLIKAKHFEVLASQANVSSVKNTGLPSLDAAYQVNYATYNNITGMASPQFFVPISGPPSASNSYDGVFGSAASLLLNWHLFTFGQRSAQIDVAEAKLQVAKADANYEVFRHKVQVVQTYLDLLLASELFKVYSKNLDRSKQRTTEIETLTRTGLRPGVDTALFKAEESRAKIELLNYEKYLETQHLAFAELLASEDVSYDHDSLFFKKLPLISVDTLSDIHPLIALSEAKRSVNEQQKKSIQRTLYPKLSLWGTTYARGSGINYDESVNSEDGLSFSRYNYGIGLQLSIPLLRFIDVRAQIGEQNSLLNAAQERINQATLQLTTEHKAAFLTLKNAIDIAHETPVFYDAAKFSYDALLSRYNAGLANYADLIQAQYNLLKAETDLKKSYLEAWNALLYMAAVKGDLNMFLNQVDNK